MLTPRTFVMLAALALAGAAVMAYARNVQAQGEAEQRAGVDLSDPSTWGDGIANAIEDLQAETGYFQGIADNMQNLDAAQNVRAFLETIKRCEGTKDAGEYSCLYGSTPGRWRTFEGFADHPRIASRISATDQRWTTAAGAYQFMAVSPIPTGGATRVDTWDRLRDRLGLPDFSPASQDAAAVELLRECGALARLHMGDLAGAVGRARGIWASLPGANYAGQGMRSMQQVAAWFSDAGGATA